MNGTPTVRELAPTGTGCARTAFSLVELIVVLAVAVLLTGLLLPAMSGVRENAQKIICSSNLRQHGAATSMFASDHNDDLMRGDPLYWDTQAPQELMAAHQGARGRADWDGLGILYDQHYCGTPEVFYCPSHHGEHTLDRYAALWLRGPFVHGPIYTNYHYAGDIEWRGNRKKRRMTDNRLVLATDGLRTTSDYNHGEGINVLFGDGSVHWEEDHGAVQDRLPIGELTDPDAHARYNELWFVIQNVIQ